MKKEELVKEAVDILLGNMETLLSKRCVITKIVDLEKQEKIFLAIILDHEYEESKEQHLCIGYLQPNSGNRIIGLKAIEGIRNHKNKNDVFWNIYFYERDSHVFLKYDSVYGQKSIEYSDNIHWHWHYLIDEHGIELHYAHPRH